MKNWGEKEELRPYWEAGGRIGNMILLAFLTLILAVVSKPGESSGSISGSISGLLGVITIAYGFIFVLPQAILLIVKGILKDIRRRSTTRPS